MLLYATGATSMHCGAVFLTLLGAFELKNL